MTAGTAYAAGPGSGFRLPYAACRWGDPARSAGDQPLHPDSVNVYLITAAGLVEHAESDIPRLLTGTDWFLWVYLDSAAPQARHVLSEVFGFHPLAVKDCIERNRVPKMHAYDDHVFVVLHAP